MKICIITCYKHPDYIRAKSLRAAAAQVDGTEVIVVKNTRRGVLRYAEVLWRVLWVRLRLHPDLYLVTFRGYEIFPFVRLLSIGKPLWYDEFVNPIEWAALEHKLIPDWKLWRVLYRLLVWPVQLILTDTESHADFSAEITGVDRHKIVALPVASDGLEVMKPVHRAKGQPFTVFFYGTIKDPNGLHGVDVVIEAAQLLKDQPVEFQFVGGGTRIGEMMQAAIDAGIAIRYDVWLEFDELMCRAAQADLCLGGPFGDTVQAQYVIGGKTYQFLQMGKPVVIGANKESHLFTDRHDSLIVEQRNPQALADAIVWAMHHPTELGRIAAAGHKLYETKLSVPVVTDKLAGLLARLEPKDR